LDSEIKERQRASIDDFIATSTDSSHEKIVKFLKDVLLSDYVNVAFPFNPLSSSVTSTDGGFSLSDAPLTKNALIGLARIATNLPSLQSQYIFCMFNLEF
jgi:hypothetical protein